MKGYKDNTVYRTEDIIIMSDNASFMPISLPKLTKSPDKVHARLFYRAMIVLQCHVPARSDLLSP